MAHQDDEYMCPACGNVWNADEVIEERNEEILQLKGMVFSLRQSLELMQSRYINEADL